MGFDIKSPEIYSCVSFARIHDADLCSFPHSSCPTNAPILDSHRAFNRSDGYYRLYVLSIQRLIVLNSSRQRNIANIR